MEIERIKNAVKKIELTEEAKERITWRCRRKAKGNGGACDRKSLSRGRIGRPAAIAALLICIIGSTAAAGYLGTFRDITDGSGAVIGTRYEHASDGIAISAVWTLDGLKVSAEFKEMNTIPYRELEKLGIQSYKIVDASGTVAAEGNAVEASGISHGGADIFIPLSGIKNGDYKLVIASFAGEKKGDQPLIIEGEWECCFSVR